MDWKDIEVGDYISVKTNNVYNPQILSGKVINIQFDQYRTMFYFNSLYRGHYKIFLRTQQTYGGKYFKEVLINSLYCTLTNILKKGEISTMPLEIGKKYKVNVPQDWTDPGQREFIGELVEIKTNQVLNYLVYSKQLEENKDGHWGDGYTKVYGCWWCNPKWLTPLEQEPIKETIKLEDIFNE